MRTEMDLGVIEMGKKRRRGGSVKRRERLIGPTPETLAKLEPDHLLALQQSGVLSLDQERAGREIAAVWRALMRGFFGQFNPDGGRISGRTRDPSDAMTPEEARIYATTYLPWAKREVRAIVVHFPKLTRCDLAYRICAANQSVAVIARTFQCEPLLIIDALRATLDSYERFTTDRMRLDKRRVS